MKKGIHVSCTKSKNVSPHEDFDVRNLSNLKLCFLLSDAFGILT